MKAKKVKKAKKSKEAWKKRYPIKTIYWVDANAGAGWNNREEAAKEHLSHCATTGYVIKDTDEFITLAVSICSEGGYNGVMNIPKVWIKGDKK